MPSRSIIIIIIIITTNANRNTMIMYIAVGAITLLLVSVTEGWYSAPILLNNRVQGRTNNRALFSSQPSTTVFDTQTIVSSMTIHSSRRKEKNRITRVPTVDSTLLRFLSTQKRHVIHSWPNPSSSRTPSSLRMEDESAAFFTSRNPATYSSITPLWADQRTPSSNLSLSSRYLDTLISTESYSTVLNQSLLSSTTLNTLPSTNNIDTSTSLSTTDFREFSTICENTLPVTSPFHADRIAQRLIDMGAPIPLAYQAGHSVQNHVSYMNTRLNIVQYLRDRSMLWKTMSGTIPSIIDPPRKENVQKTLQGEIYDIEQVLDVLASAGFTGKDIAAIFVHTPTIARMKAKSTGEETEESMTTLQDTLQHTYFGLLCEVFKLRKCDARKIVRSCPGLLTKKGSKAAKDVTKILFSLGVTATSLTRDKSVLVSLLSRSPQMIFRLVAFLSSDCIKMPFESIGPVIRRMECEQLLDAVAPLSNSPSSLKAQPTNITDFRTTCTNSLTLDSFLTNDTSSKSRQVDETYKQMVSTATFLVEDIRISDLGKVISSFPSALLLDRDTQIRPSLEFLMTVVGIDMDEIPRIIESFPLLLAANVTNMEIATQYLLSLEVSPDVIGSIVRAFPSILTLSIEEKMMPVVAFLKHIGVTNIGRFVTRLPPVLGYSVSDELIPKWNYLNQTCQYASFELIRFPAYFSYPLERVIMNRYEYLRTIKRMPVQLLPVDDILRYGDSDFAKIIANDQDEGREYMKFIAERNKLRRQA